MNQYYGVKGYTREIHKKMNTLLISGILTRIPTLCDYVWGVNSFYNSDHSILVEKIEGRFLGGGICESYGYNVTLGSYHFHHMNLFYVLKCTYNYLVKKGVVKDD